MARLVDRPPPASALGVVHSNPEWLHPTRRTHHLGASGSTACGFLLQWRIMAQFQVLQPETTYTGSHIQALQTGLPKTTQSLCPECSQLIDARIFEEDGKVVMEK